MQLDAETHGPRSSATGASPSLLVQGLRGKDPPARRPSPTVRTVWSLALRPIPVKASSPARRLRTRDSCGHSLAFGFLVFMVLMLVTQTLFQDQCFLAVHLLHPRLAHPGRVVAVQYWPVSPTSGGTTSPETKQNQWAIIQFILGPRRLLLLGCAPLSLSL